MHPTALLCTAILGLLVFLLGLAISALRFRENRLTGFSDAPTDLLHKLVRAHGNTTEYAPFLAVLFLYLGAHQPPGWVIALIVAATVFRVLLVVGLVAWPRIDRPNPLRFVGALGTYLAGAGLCVASLMAAA